MNKYIRHMMVGVICWHSLLFNVDAAEKRTIPEATSLVGMTFHESKVPKGYRAEENILVTEYKLEQGKRYGTSIFRFGRIKRMQHQFLWLARPAGGENWTVIDVLPLPPQAKGKLIQAQYRTVAGDHGSTISDRVYGWLNKNDYSVIRAWAIDYANGKIAEIPTKGLVFEDDENLFLFTGSDPSAGAVTDLELARFVGKQSGQESTLPSGVRNLGGYLLENDDAVGFYIYKKSRIALLEKFIRRDAEGKPYFRVLDAIRLDMANNETNEADCEGGAAMRLVIVDKRTYRARRAWTADVRQGKFVKIPVKGITCTAPDHGD